MNSDEKFMKFAINEVKKAPFPFGAILVKDGKIIAKAGSGSTDGLDPTAHAEINVIRIACRNLQSRMLKGAFCMQLASRVRCVSLRIGSRILRVLFLVSR